MSDLVPITCASCGTTFGIEPEIEYYMRLSEVGFSCPLGHGNVFIRQKGVAPKKRKAAGESATILKLVPPDNAA